MPNEIAPLVKIGKLRPGFLRLCLYPGRFFLDPTREPLLRLRIKSQALQHTVLSKTRCFPLCYTVTLNSPYRHRKTA